MASFRLNFARVRGLPTIGKLISSLRAFGMPPEQEFGVLDSIVAGDAVSATLLHRTNRPIRQIDATRTGITMIPIEHVAVYPMRLFPSKGRIEIHGGSSNAVGRVHEFLASHLSLPVLTELLDLDVARAIEKLSGTVEKFQLRSVRVAEYSVSSYASGPYRPRFLDSEHGMEFIGQHDGGVVEASVRFSGQHGKVSAVISQKACFRYRCRRGRQGIRPACCGAAHLTYQAVDQPGLLSTPEGMLGSVSTAPACR